MADVTVTFRPPGGGEPFVLTGQEGDHGVVGDIERSGGSYEPTVLAALQSRLGPGSVSFDVGANIGAVTLVLSRLSPGGAVFAFEPAPANFAYLRRNLADNGAANVVAEALALYDENGPVPFEVSEVYPAGSHVTAGDEATTFVEGVRLDDYVERRGVERVDLVKLDVEGAEMRALRGAQRTLARFRPDLVVEVNPVALRRFHRVSFRDLAALLRSSGYSLFAVDARGRSEAVVSDGHLARLLAKHGVVNVLALARRHGAPLPCPAPPAAWARGARTLARLHARSNRWRCPGVEFVVEPALVLDVPAGEVRGAPGEHAVVEVRVENRSRHWLSSGFPYHPVRASYHWYDAGGRLLVEDGRRTDLPRPLAPGAARTVELDVELPAEPGAYELGVTFVQEAFAWFDQLDPGLCRRVPAVVG